MVLNFSDLFGLRVEMPFQLLGYEYRILSISYLHM
uniref:Uncharacterized protein n=1 Tax=Arundo donax TaxID=35708 RepID=A0A0A8XVT7_ARUDO